MTDIPPVSEPIDADSSVHLNHAPNVPEKKPNSWHFPVTVFIGIVIVGAFAVLAGPNVLKKGNSEPKPQTVGTGSPVGETKNATFSFSEAAFAQYKEVPSLVKPSIQKYSLTASELVNMQDVARAAPIQFSTLQNNALESRGFFTVPTKPKISDPHTVLSQTGSRSDDMVDLYRDIGGDPQMWKRKPENAVFVSSDFMLHIFHVLVDRSFQKTEEVNFQPTLKAITDALSADALARYEKETDGTLKDSWKRLSVYYLVPRILLSASVSKQKAYFDSPDDQDAHLKQDSDIDTASAVLAGLESQKSTVPKEVYELAKQELTLIMEAKGFGVSSPLFGPYKPTSSEDYTQYTPRSHYTRNSILRSYFRAMMWYGRNGFDVVSPELTRDALLLSWQLGATTVSESPALEHWQKIYLPTVFFVGKSDDLTIYEYADLIGKIYGKPAPYSALSDAVKFEQFQSQAKALQGPKILSEIKRFDMKKAPTKDALLKGTKGFRFMGQRFIPDSYMFSSLTQGDELPDPTTGQRLPSTPTALMIMSILGSDTADTLLTDWIAQNAPQSDRVIAKVKGELTKEFTSYDEKTWTQNMYWSWLYTLRALFQDHADGYPMFMRGVPWAKKSLITALGSWTELRHDTLLYAKQSFAELGGGGEPPPPPPVPKGYVEPNMTLITRLIALATMTRDGLESRKLLVPGQKEKFDSYIESLQFFKSIAEKELSSGAISDEEYEKLRTIIRLKFPNIVWTPDGDEMTEEDARIGIIADVHSDAKKQQILYEATGAPAVLYVAVKDAGGARLTRGVTYSYYEFSKPVGRRLTDHDWQGMIYEGKNSRELPSVPEWAVELQ